MGETNACSRKHEILIMFIMPKGFVSRRCTHTAHVLARAVRGVASGRREKIWLIFNVKFKYILYKRNIRFNTLNLTFNIVLIYFKYFDTNFLIF